MVDGEVSRAYKQSKIIAEGKWAMGNSTIDLNYEDYAQSANALFHFVPEAQYLDGILQKRALTPRYCGEDMSYLGLQVNGVSFPNIAILQKCFCDIPFHKLMATSEIELIDCEPDPNKKEKWEMLSENAHPKFYGEYAIALSR